jgi:hypothetical protein
MASDGVKTDAEVNSAVWKQAVTEFKGLRERETGEKFPQDPWQQLKSAVEHG